MLTQPISAPFAVDMDPAKAIFHTDMLVILENLRRAVSARIGYAIKGT